MFLKKYQIKVVDELKKFYELAYKNKSELESAIKTLPEGLRHTVANTNWVENSFLSLAKNCVDKPKNGLNKFYPRFVIKIPTGGGKTLIAVEAIREYQNLFAHRKTGLVVWIVPSETIYSQTIKKLRDKGNPLRQLLDQASGNRTIILEKGQKLNTTDLTENLVILFIMIQSISRSNAKEALKVFEDSGGYEGFFPEDNRYDLHDVLIKQFPNLDKVSDAQSAFPQIRTSLGNAIRVSSPLIIIDEIHKVFSQQAKQTIDNLNPELVLGLSATPKPEMNKLVTITGLELKEEDMVKLDLHILPPVTTSADGWKNMLKEIKRHRDKLEKEAKKYDANTGIYIRPIALLQVEATGKDQRGRVRVHSLDVKEYLIDIGIPEHEIAIKTSSQNDIEDVDLLSRTTEYRYLITKEALREGWDCPFAYILGIIPNVGSNTGVTQLVGRILRQPYARKTNIKTLDESYVYYFRGDTRAMLDQVTAGFRNEGLEDLVRNVKAESNPEINQTKKVKIKSGYKKYSNSFYLPVWLFVSDEKNKRRFSYHLDIKSNLDFNKFKITDTEMQEIKNSLSKESSERRGYAINLDKTSKTTHTEELEEVFIRDELNISYFTRRINELVDNPFMSRLLANNITAQLKKLISKNELNEHFSFIVSRICSLIEIFIATEEQNIFKKYLLDQKLILAVSDDKNLGYKIPESQEIIDNSTGFKYKYYLFEDVELVTMNSLEKKVGDILEKQEKILWWFRNKFHKENYSIQGWKENAVWPDFVAAKKKDDGNIDLIYIIESKGEHLIGNPGTLYKNSLLEIMTRQKQSNGITKYQQLKLPFGEIHDNFEFYLIEQDQEESKLRHLLK